MGDLYDEVEPETTAVGCIERAAKAMARAEYRAKLRADPKVELTIARAYMQLAKVIEPEDKD